MIIVKIEYLNVSTDKFLELVSNIYKAYRRKKNKNNYIPIGQQQKVRKCKKRRKRVKKKIPLPTASKLFKYLAITLMKNIYDLFPKIIH